MFQVFRFFNRILSLTAMEMCTLKDRPLVSTYYVIPWGIGKFFDGLKYNSLSFDLILSHALLSYH